MKLTAFHKFSTESSLGQNLKLTKFLSSSHSAPFCCRSGAKPVDNLSPSSFYVMATGHVKSSLKRKRNHPFRIFIILFVDSKHRALRDSAVEV